jgi:hypothetical protein
MATVTLIRIAHSSVLIDFDGCKILTLASRACLLRFA